MYLRIISFWTQVFTTNKGFPKTCSNHPKLPTTLNSPSLSRVIHECLCDGVELGCGHVHEHVVKPALPLVAVRYSGHFERGAVEQDELLVGDGVHLLYFVAHLDVLSDGLVKVGHTRILSSPPTEERVFLHLPNHLHTVQTCYKISTKYFLERM